MSNAWETTAEDILNVLEKNGIKAYDIEECKVEEIISQLDHALIEASALYGNDMDEQVQFAYEEIEAQLKRLGVIHESSNEISD